MTTVCNVSYGFCPMYTHQYKSKCMRQVQIKAMGAEHSSLIFVDNCDHRLRMRRLKRSYTRCNIRMQWDKEARSSIIKPPEEESVIFEPVSKLRSIRASRHGGDV